MRSLAARELDRASPFKGKATKSDMERYHMDSGFTMRDSQWLSIQPIVLMVICVYCYPHVVVVDEMDAYLDCIAQLVGDMADLFKRVAHVPDHQNLSAKVPKLHN